LPGLVQPVGTAGLTGLPGLVQPVGTAGQTGLLDWHALFFLVFVC